MFSYGGKNYVRGLFLVKCETDWALKLMPTGYSNHKVKNNKSLKQRRYFRVRHYIIYISEIIQ